MDKFVIHGNRTLKGTIHTSGAKNASLALMPATILAPGSYRLSNTHEALLGSLATLGADRSGRRRVAFLGEMLELGEPSMALHGECGRAVVAAGVRALVTVGTSPARALGEEAIVAGLDREHVRHVADSRLAADLVPGVVRSGDLVLVKGSRGIRMELVVERLEAEFSCCCTTSCTRCTGRSRS